MQTQSSLFFPFSSLQTLEETQTLLVWAKLLALHSETYTSAAPVVQPKAMLSNNA